ncbi:hypothetical protein RJ639_030364 [Escallonia herrerae]|uniref:Uncharacterized protein n=1 Tax=Escallonia herrerae TaxID=1293975 RepID=A0AA88X0S1_9ASTE|nr:hypothetical protein RJ639_030364 [Escallonia herrerae]
MHCYIIFEFNVLLRSGYCPANVIWGLLLRDYNEANEYIQDIKDICDDFEGLCQRNLSVNTGTNFYDFLVFVVRFSFSNIAQLYHLATTNLHTSWRSSQMARQIIFNLESSQDIALKMKSTGAADNQSVIDFKTTLEDSTFMELCLNFGRTYLMIHEQCELNLDRKQALEVDLLDLGLLRPRRLKLCEVLVATEVTIKGEEKRGIKQQHNELSQLGQGNSDKDWQRGISPIAPATQVKAGTQRSPSTVIGAKKPGLASNTDAGSASLTCTRRCGFDLHPCCANLPRVLDDGEHNLYLSVNRLSTPCHCCRGKGPGWSNRTRCSTYNLHVSCVKELLVESWQTMYLNVDKNKAKELQTRIPSLKGTLRNHHKGRGGYVSKCCQMAGGAVRVVVSAILGDPTAIIAAVVGGFISKQ